MQNIHLEMDANVVHVAAVLLRYESASQPAILLMQQIQLAKHIETVSMQVEHRFAEGVATPVDAVMQSFRVARRHTTAAHHVHVHSVGLTVKFTDKAPLHCPYLLTVH